MNTCRRSLFFVAPGRVEVREESMPVPGPDEVLVETVVSAISPGTEMLVYRGRVPAGMSLDATIAGLTDAATYPLKCGYASVGRVVETGAGVSSEWQDRLVFSLHPHETHYVVPLADVAPVPTGMAADHAALYPHAETAVTFVMDGRPMVG